MKLKNPSQQEWLGLVRAGAYALWQSATTGGSTFSQATYKWVTEPRPGDLVMEVSSIGLSVKDDDRIGYLVSHQKEPCFTPEEWEKKVGVGVAARKEKVPEEWIYRITRLTNGQEVRWENARFIRVPERLNDMFELLDTLA
jgi:hypothetical protein